MLDWLFSHYSKNMNLGYSGIIINFANIHNILNCTVLLTMVLVEFGNDKSVNMQCVCWIYALVVASMSITTFNYK